MTKDEALKLAMDWYGSGNQDPDEFERLILSIVAQPEQEPVAWLIWLHGPAGHFDHKQFAELEFERRNKEYPDPDRKLLPLYTTPPQRKPLTDEQRDAIARQAAENDWHDYEVIDAVEAAHGIKGEA